MLSLPAAFGDSHDLASRGLSLHLCGDRLVASGDRALDLFQLLTGLREINFLGRDGPLRDHRDGIVADLDESTFDEHPPHGIGRPALFAGKPHFTRPKATDEGRMTTTNSPLAVK